MDRPQFEVADVFRCYGADYRLQNGASMSNAQHRVMTAIEVCRTAVLGGHLEQCDQCGHQRGQIRSVRMHVSMNYFQAHRPRDLAWTVPAENFSHILSIYGGHLMDMLFHVVGAPQTVSAVVVNQFPTITITDTGETFPNTTPDQALVIGTLANGGVFTFQAEGGKRNNSGLQIDITGMKGDLKISNPLSFANPDDHKIEGSQGDNESLNILPVPDSYQGLPGSKLDASVLDLAHLYAAFAKGGDKGAYDAPTFADAVRMHRLIDLIAEAASTGTRQAVTFW